MRRITNGRETPSIPAASFGVTSEPSSATQTDTVLPSASRVEIDSMTTPIARSSPGGAIRK
jgi:hypothetical protein